jgi:hypothetical protein
MPTRRETLDAYIRAVVGDMIARGVIRQQKGWTIAQILRAEGPKVMAEVMADFETVLTSVGGDLARGAVNMLEAAAKRLIGNWFASRPSR